MNKLKKEKIISFNGEKYIFNKDFYYFNSLSTASSSFFMNHSTNDKMYWKTIENKTFKELYES